MKTSLELLFQTWKTANANEVNLTFSVSVFILALVNGIKTGKFSEGIPILRNCLSIPPDAETCERSPMLSIATTTRLP